MYRFSNSRKMDEKGFTVAELLVSIAIMLVIISSVLFGQATYTDGINLSSAADNVSLSLFQAQAYGVGAREVSLGSGSFKQAYGISFSTDGGGFNKHYILFADKAAKNKRYDFPGSWADCEPSSECLEKNVLPGKNYISSICVLRSSGAEICNTVGRVDVAFERPNTEANLTFFNNGGGVYSPSNIIGAKIYITYPDGPTKVVVVYLTGQISVQ